MNLPVDNEHLFLEQATALQSAHGQGHEVFEAAAYGTLSFVVDYPDRVNKEGEQADDDRIAMAYTSALCGLSRVITEERLRHDFIGTISTQLDSGEAATSEPRARGLLLTQRTLPFMIKALRNSFPDEEQTLRNRLVVVDTQTAQDSRVPDQLTHTVQKISENHSELETTDPEQFDTMINRLITHAESIDRIIQASNRAGSNITIDRSSIYDSVTLFFNEENCRTAIAHCPASYIKQVYTDQGAQRVKTKLLIEQADFKAGRGGFSWPHGLEGHLSVMKNSACSEADLNEKQVINATNRILAKIRGELTRRQKLFEEASADVQDVVDGRPK